MQTDRPRRIVLPGGSGQVGNLLARHFHSRGDSVVVLSRRPVSAPWQVITWDGESIANWTNALEGADVVINLAGRSVNCRYTQKNRKEILDSRVRSTRVIGEAFQQICDPPALWMNASTATMYRHALDRPMDEATGELGGNEVNAPSSWHFSIDVATRWEAAFFAARADHTRKIALRSAMTMSPDRGGIFDTLLRLVRYGLGGTSGSGQQFVSWIHEDDFVAAIDYLIDHPQISGCVNLAAPVPLPNREFMRELRHAWGTNIGLPAYGWMLAVGAVFMRTETELILKSRRVIPGRLNAARFQFKFPDWHSASRDLVRRWRDTNQRKIRVQALAAAADSRTR